MQRVDSFGGSLDAFPATTASRSRERIRYGALVLQDGHKGRVDNVFPELK